MAHPGHRDNGQPCFVLTVQMFALFSICLTPSSPRTFLPPDIPLPHHLFPVPSRPVQMFAHSQYAPRHPPPRMPAPFFPEHSFFCLIRPSPLPYSPTLLNPLKCSHSPTLFALRSMRPMPSSPNIPSARHTPPPPPFPRSLPTCPNVRISPTLFAFPLMRSTPSSSPNIPSAR